MFVYELITVFGITQMRQHLNAGKHLQCLYSDALSLYCEAAAFMSKQRSGLRMSAPCKGEIPIVQIFDLCNGCISLSNAEGL